METTELLNNDASRDEYKEGIPTLETLCRCVLLSSRFDFDYMGI